MYPGDRIWCSREQRYSPRSKSVAAKSKDVSRNALKNTGRLGGEEDVAQCQLRSCGKNKQASWNRLRRWANVTPNTPLSLEKKQCKQKHGDVSRERGNLPANATTDVATATKLRSARSTPCGPDRQEKSPTKLPELTAISTEVGEMEITSLSSHGPSKSQKITMLSYI
jgi:hypothetical protein